MCDIPCRVFVSLLVTPKSLSSTAEDSRELAPHSARYPDRSRKRRQPPRYLFEQTLVNNPSSFSREMSSREITLSNTATYIFSFLITYSKGCM